MKWIETVEHKQWCAEAEGCTATVSMTDTGWAWDVDYVSRSGCANTRADAVLEAELAATGGAWERLQQRVESLEHIVWGLTARLGRELGDSARDIGAHIARHARKDDPDGV